MNQELQFTHAAFVAWALLTQTARGLRHVDRRLPVPRAERIGAPGFEQHCVPTLIIGLAGTTRVELTATLELGPADALLIAPGVWHRHLPLDAQGSCFRQGFFGGRSDFHLVSGGQNLVASIPREPAWSGFHSALAATDAQARRELLTQTLAETLAQSATPLRTPHPAVLRMEHTLWHTLHLNKGVERIVAASGLGRAQAYRLAQTHWGEGIAEFRLHARMELALSLLRAGISVTETAFRCGFGSRRGFSRSFVAFHGRHPSDVLGSTTDC